MLEYEPSSGALDDDEGTVCEVPPVEIRPDYDLVARLYRGAEPLLGDVAREVFHGTRARR